MKPFIFIIILTLFQSCATRTDHTDTLLSMDRSYPDAHTISNVPFIDQEYFYCGPSALAMVMNHAGYITTAGELAYKMYTPGKFGTFRSDIHSAVRRQGMLGIPVRSLDHLLHEVSRGTPILIFQNQGFDSWPKWHYAVVVGYDLSGPDIILHTGEKNFHKTDLRMFERSWSKGGHWALAVLPPNKLTETSNDHTLVTVINELEKSGKTAEAELAYKTMLEKFPKSLPGLIGLSNLLFSQGRFTETVRYLEYATTLYPTSAMAWHNLAIAQGAEGNSVKAHMSSLQAIGLADRSKSETFKQSLKQWLKK